MSLADIQALKAKNLIQANYRLQSRIMEVSRMTRDSQLSLNRSNIGYSDTNSTIFTENWANLTNWVTPGTPGVQVSGNQLYSTGSGGSGSGANHAISLGANENLRAIFNVTIPSLPSSGGLIVGVSKDTAGGIPTGGGGQAFGFYLTNLNLAIMNSGTITYPTETNQYTAGSYIVTLTVDSTYISLSIVKSDGTNEACIRVLRSSFPVNNLYIFNSDARALTGISVGLVSVRRGLQTLYPRTSFEGVTKTIQWTGDGTQSWRIYLPKTYDSRVPNPVVICFHGLGTDETQWSINTNYILMQKTLVNNGFIVLSCNFNANNGTWGNTSSTNAYYQAYLYLKRNYAISSVCIFANSMGGIESLNALMENNIPCVAWAGTSPTYSLLNNYQNPTFTAGVKSAYNIASDGSDYATKTAGRDPSLMNPTSFRCVPMMILAAPDDTMVSKTANGDVLAAAVQNTSYELQKIDVPSGGHSFDISPYMGQIAAFFNKYSTF